MYGQNIDGKSLPPELTKSKANAKAIAFCRRKLRGLPTNTVHYPIKNAITTHSTSSITTFSYWQKVSIPEHPVDILYILFKTSKPITIAKSFNIKRNTAIVLITSNAIFLKPLHCYHFVYNIAT